jgi:glycosyltransferase involved in cell wall biosynthesis
MEVNAWNIDTCDEHRLLFVGRFDKRKGGDTVLFVFTKLAEIHPNVKLTFVGPDRGIIGSDNNVSNFEQFVRDNVPSQFQARIEFCGRINHSDVMQLRLRSFCTIIASQYEIMPYSVLEAMSLGCPLVATAVGGIPEMITDQRNGLLVPCQNEGAMIAACNKLLANRDLATRLGRQALRDCHDLYGSQNIAKQTVAAYQAAIDRFKLQNAR